MEVRTGQTLGSRYVLIRELGAGGIGQVWLARERHLGREVAIKVLQERAAQGASDDFWKRDELLERFAVEAQAVAGLDHPGIPAVYDWSSGELERGEPPFLAMQYIKGKNLDAVLTDETGGRLTLAEGACLGAQLSSILAAVHGAGSGVFHRDLKPANVMVTVEGRVSLVDFGSAFIVAPDRPRVTTRSRLVPTTSGYTAPEILAGRSAPAARSDLYALGCVLYQVLGGAVFEARTTAELDSAHLERSPEPLRARNPDVPEEFERLVMQLLEKDCARRPQDACEVFGRLRPFTPTSSPEGVGDFMPYDLTLPFRDPCRPLAGGPADGKRHRTGPPRTVAAAEVNASAVIEDLRRMGDLVGQGQRVEARTLLREIVAVTEREQGVAGKDVRRALSSGVRIFLEASDLDSAKAFWEELKGRACRGGVDSSDRFIQEALAALRAYHGKSSSR